MKKTKLLPLLILPLLLVGCSDSNATVNEGESHEWTANDIKVFEKINAKNSKGELITIPYDVNLFMTLKIETYNEEKPTEPTITYESNYDLSYEFETNKAYLYFDDINDEGHTNSVADRYIETVKKDTNWILDESKTDASKHDYLYYQELVFNDSDNVSPESGSKRLNLNVYENEGQLAIALWSVTSMEFASFPKDYINLYFELNEELPNFVAPDNATKFETRDGIRIGMPYLDIKVSSKSSTNLSDYIAKLKANNFIFETYHPYDKYLDNYYLNQSYYSDIYKGTVSQSLDVYLDRTQASDNSFNMRLSVSYKVEI